MSDLRAGSAVETYPVLIGGERRLAACGETIDARNPATGELIGRFPRCGASDVAAAVAAAARRVPRLARDAGDRARAPGCSSSPTASARTATSSRRSTSPTTAARSARCATTSRSASAELRYFAGLALQLRGETIPVAHGRLNYTLREPYGVVGRIVPVQPSA